MSTNWFDSLVAIFISWCLPANLQVISIRIQKELRPSFLTTSPTNP